MAKQIINRNRPPPATACLSIIWWDEYGFNLQSTIFNPSCPSSPSLLYRCYYICRESFSIQNIGEPAFCDGSEIRRLLTDPLLHTESKNPPWRLSGINSIICASTCKKVKNFRIFSNVSRYFSNIFEYFQTFSNVFERFRTQLAHLIEKSPDFACTFDWKVCKNLPNLPAKLPQSFILLPTCVVFCKHMTNLSIA